MKDTPLDTDLLNDMVRRSAKVSDDAVARLDLDEALSEMLAEVAREPRTERRERRRDSWLARYRRPALGIKLTRPAMAALLIAGVLTALVAAVPPVRAALGELADTLADHTLVDYFDGEDPPGRPLESSDSPPAWLVAGGQTGQRVIASSGPYSLYLAHELGGGGYYNFGLDDSVGIGDTTAGWKRQFADNSVVILGPGTSEHARRRVPLYGVTAGDVAEVEVRYESGPASTASAKTGGFVVMIEPARGPVELVALDRDGKPLQVVNARRFASIGKPPAARGARRAHAERPRRERRVTVPENAIHIPERSRRRGGELSRASAAIRGPVVRPGESGSQRDGPRRNRDRGGG